jgi:hypothetical protein
VVVHVGCVYYVLALWLFPGDVPNSSSFLMQITQGLYLEVSEKTFCYIIVNQCHIKSKTGLLERICIGQQILFG